MRRKDDAEKGKGTRVKRVYQHERIPFFGQDISMVLLLP